MEITGKNVIIILIILVIEATITEKLLYIREF